MELKILTNDPNTQVYKDGVLLAGTAGGGQGGNPYPPEEFPAGPPPNSDAVFNFPWPHNQGDFECTLGEHVQTVRLVVPTDFGLPGKRCWIKVVGYPGGESLLNSRMIKNNVIQRAWWNYPAEPLAPTLQEDFCVVKPVDDLQVWEPGDIIDFQFKSQTGKAQPVRCTVFTGETQ